MNASDKVSQDTKSQSRVPMVDKTAGFFNSATIAEDPDRVFDFCQNEANIEKVLTDLPLGVDNFLDLVLVSAQQPGRDEYEIRWQNRPGTKVKGTLQFLLRRAPANRGTLLSAIAEFKELHPRDEEPSDMMNVFIKRMKALIETGELPTTKGQPTGRHELQEQNKKLH